MASSLPFQAILTVFTIYSGPRFDIERPETEADSGERETSPSGTAQETRKRVSMNGLLTDSCFSMTLLPHWDGRTFR